jgi:hypothetical protein
MSVNQAHYHSVADAFGSHEKTGAAVSEDITAARGIGLAISFRPWPWSDIWSRRISLGSFQRLPTTVSHSALHGNDVLGTSYRIGSWSGHRVPHQDGPNHLADRALHQIRDDGTAERPSDAPATSDDHRSNWPRRRARGERAYHTILKGKPFSEFAKERYGQQVVLACCLTEIMTCIILSVYSAVRFGIHHALSHQFWMHSSFFLIMIALGHGLSYRMIQTTKVEFLEHVGTP